ncbi:pitrilysin family protein [Longimicrobium sp.]|uniref:M16 family metallopeptidase n=1 Tax=Longimicrobium sp. TaxID=2029185 RepID=UPI002E353441|nr:pitrilysin family protein [Longimicrobium sp.]HEX6039618.1 pitrilysin family protein [Longimicrobium sp.]
MPPETLAILPPPVPGAPPRPRVPAPERWTMANGLRVVALPKHGIPQVVLRLALPAGGAADPPQHPGTASLVAHLLTEGTQSMSADELNARLDLLGAAMHANVGHDFAEVEAILLSETLEEGIALLAEVVTRPAFPEKETERVRAESLDALIARGDEPANVADDRAALEVFGPGHPYGHPSFGTPEGIRTVPRDTLAAFHAERYRPRGAFIVAAGDFDTAELRARLEAGFADWTGEAPPVVYPAGTHAPENAGRDVVTPWEDAAQSEIRIAGPGLDRRSDDWLAGAVANYILGGSTITGRLGANLREDKGWTYGARSAFHPGLALGGWEASTAVDVEVTADAVREMLGEMRRMTEAVVPDDELRRAKDALILSLPRMFETPGGLAGRFVTVEAFGLPDDYWDRYADRIEAVTAEDVLRIARRCFDPERLVRVVVGGGM